jgi:hypothetical protein
VEPKPAAAAAVERIPAQMQPEHWESQPSLAAGAQEASKSAVVGLVESKPVVGVQEEPRSGQVEPTSAEVLPAAALPVAAGASKSAAQGRLRSGEASKARAEEQPTSAVASRPVEERPAAVGNQASCRAGSWERHPAYILAYLQEHWLAPVPGHFQEAGRGHSHRMGKPSLLGWPAHRCA